MDKKKVKTIISKTILFLVIMTYVAIFELIFGKENLLVGVTILITLLMLLAKDLTQNPIKNFFILLFINFATGIGAYISDNNVWIGIIIDFLELSLIGYYFSYAMTKGLIIPYGLQYLFLLNYPASGNALTKRWIALAVGAVLIMISQFIVNAKKSDNFKKESSIISIGGHNNDNAYKTVNIFGKDVKIHIRRASYAIRVGFLTALTVFITNYFHLAEGRWMTFTIFSLTELYSENAKIKAKKRIEGTIIGILVLAVYFYFVKNSAARGAIMLLAGYLNSFATDYRDMMILTTITAVAPVALSEGETYAIIHRIFYVIIGMILALLANRFILRKSKKDYNI